MTRLSIYFCFIFLLSIVFCCPLISIAENLKESNPMNLKSMLHRDFGLDLMITGGFGQSPDAPIVVTAKSYEDAALTEVLVLRGIGKGRGILWRILEKTIQKQENSWLEKVKIETKQVTEEEVITQRENYYFTVSMPSSRYKFLPMVVDIETSMTEFSLPYEIGWLHFDKLINNEPQNPGLGQTIAYGAPGIKATVYVYDKGLSNIPKGVDSPIVRNEFKEAVIDMVKLNSELELMGLSEESDTIILQNVAQGGDQGFVAMMTHQGLFVKLRITHVRDPLLTKLVSEFLSSFQNILSGSER